MPWSRKCESTLLRALKVVLLEGLLLEWPWTVHREKSAAHSEKSQKKGIIIDKERERFFRTRQITIPTIKR